MSTTFYEKPADQKAAFNPLGVKGAGESGTTGSLAAIMNAINDALAQEGAPYVQMPCTPEKVWRALQEANSRIS